MADDKVTKAVQAEVSKAIEKKGDLSWIRRDWVVLGALFAVLAVLAVTTTISANRAADAARKTEEVVRNTNVLEECFTPGTPCSNFVAAGDKAEQEYFAKLMTDTALCTILTSRRLTGVTDLGQVEQVYRQCVAERTSPPPSSTGPGG